MKEMAFTLLDLTMRIRGGMLIFFPSYSFMENFHKLIVDEGISLKIKREARKDIIIEKDSEHFNENL
jgi:Rad3-related DNA helicase